MGRRLLATALMAAGLSLGIAGTANAAPVKLAASTPSTIERPAAWFTVDWYEMLGECQTAGSLLISSGQYKAFICQQDGARWALRVLE